MRHKTLLLAICLLTCACERDPASHVAPAASPSIRLPAVPGRPGAAYFELRGVGDRGALLSVTSPQVGRIEMHETMTAGTMSSMRPIARVAPENGGIVFRPGGRHLMLYDVDPRLASGSEAILVFHFERGEPLRRGAAVLAAGSPGDHDGH